MAFEMPAPTRNPLGFNPWTAALNFGSQYINWRNVGRAFFGRSNARREYERGLAQQQRIGAQRLQSMGYSPARFTAQQQRNFAGTSFGAQQAQRRALGLPERTLDEAINQDAGPLLEDLYRRFPELRPAARAAQPASAPAPASGGNSMSLNWASGGGNFIPYGVDFPALTTLDELNNAAATTINTALGLTDSTNNAASMVKVWQQWAASRFGQVGAGAVDVLRQVLPMLAQYYVQKRLIDKQAKLGGVVASATQTQIDSVMEQLDAAYRDATGGVRNAFFGMGEDEVPAQEQIGAFAGACDSRGGGAALVPSTSSASPHIFRPKGTQCLGPVKEADFMSPDGKVYTFRYAGRAMLYSEDFAAMRRGTRAMKRVAKELGYRISKGSSARRTTRRRR